MWRGVPQADSPVFLPQYRYRMGRGVGLRQADSPNLSTLIPVPDVWRGTTGRTSPSPYLNGDTACRQGHHMPTVPVSIPQCRYCLWTRVPQVDSPSLSTSMPVPHVDRGTTGRESPFRFSTSMPVPHVERGITGRQSHLSTSIPVPDVWRGITGRQSQSRLSTSIPVPYVWRATTGRQSQSRLSTSIPVPDVWRGTIGRQSPFLYLNTGKPTAGGEGYHRPTVSVSLLQYWYRVWRQVGLPLADGSRLSTSIPHFILYYIYNFDKDQSNMSVSQTLVWGVIRRVNFVTRKIVLVKFHEDWLMWIILLIII